MTISQKAERFGCHDRELAHLLWEQELLRRLDSGEVLTKADARSARRIKRERAALASR
jgi:hypothetical protein